MRQTAIVWLVALMLGASSRAFAQARFEDLALSVDLGDPIRVEERSGTKAAGRLTGLTFDEIVVRTDAGDRRFAREAVREVALRDYGLRRGAVIGAGVMAVLGAVAMCAHGEEHCALIGPVAAAPIGAGVGLAIGALVPRARAVFHASENLASTTPPPAGAQSGFLADLALRANLDDRIEVEDRSGARITGRLTQLTAEAITVRTDGGQTQLTREMVRRVAVRRRPLRVAVLIGAGTGAAAGAVAACAGANREECADAPILAGALGAGIGLAAGALMHKTTVAYRGADAQVRVEPVMWRDAIGVRLGRQW